MINSIQHFLENGTLKLEKAQINFFKNPSQLDSLIEETKQVILSFALDFLRETLEECDEAIRNSDIRKQDFTIVRKDTKTLFTTLGSFSFQKTLFLEKCTNKHCYLLDQLLELEPYTRITNEAVACMIESVTNSSYQETVDQVSLGDFLSKQTVKNKVHSLDFSNPSQVQKEKKTVDFLYIDADEDALIYIFQAVPLTKADTHPVILDDSSTHNPSQASQLRENPDTGRYSIHSVWHSPLEYRVLHFDTNQIKDI